MADALVINPEPGSISPALNIRPTPTEEQLFSDLNAPTGLKPINPLARQQLAAADPLAEFERVPESYEDAGGAKKIDLNARAKLGGFKEVPDPLSEFERVSDFDTRSVEELDKDRENFDPVSYFAQNPDASSDPVKLKKLLDVYRKRREEGLTAGGVIKAAVKETPGLVADIAGGVKRVGERVIDIAVQPTATIVLGTLTGDLFNKQRRGALFDETKKIVKKGTAEIAAGAESATVGLVDLSRTGLRKLDPASLQPGNRLPPGRFNPPTGHAQTLKPKTDQELLSDIADDASFRQNAEDILVGQGESAKNFGLDKETMAKQGIELDPEAIGLLSLVDPVTMVATGGAFKLVGLGGKVLGTAKTLAGAKYATEKLADIARYSTSKVAKGSGRVLTDIGKAAESRTLGAIGLASPLITGDISTLAATAAVKYAAGPLAKKTGARLTQLGKEIAGDVPRSAGVQRLIGLTEATAAGAETVGQGAFKGIVAGSPFAIAAETDEQAGALLGVGAALGAGGATGAKSFRVVKDSTSRRYFGPNRPVLPDVPSPSYGLDATLDTQHETNIKKLSAQDASELNNFREALRSKGGEIYVVDAPTFRQKMTEIFPDITPELLDTYANHSAFFDAKLGDRKVVYLNSDTKGLAHDAGHIFDALLSPEKRAELRTAVEEAFTPEQRQAFRETYERRVGSKISDAAAVDEFIAEQFSSLFNNVPVTELNAPKSLLNKFIDAAAEGAEALGIDLSAGATTPTLGAPVSVGIRQLFRNAAGEVTRKSVEARPEGVTPPTPEPPVPAPLPTPEPPVPAPLPTPAPLADAARPIRPSGTDLPPATPEARAAAAKRFSETGIEAARQQAKSDPVIAKAVEDVSVHMEAGNPVLEIDHLGIVSKGTPDSPEGRTSRRATQAAGYEALKGELSRAGAPDDLVASHLKTFVPVRWTNQGGTPTLSAMSLDKALQNIQKLGSDPKAASLIPYPTEKGKLTPQGWRDAVSDLRAYAENQANGRRGDGGRLTVPEAGELSIPADNPAYTPQPLSPEKANFANVVQGLLTPETSRSQKGKTPGNIKGQLLAEANLRPTEIPAKIPVKQAGKQAFVDFPPRVVKEVNPLRNRLKEAGVNTGELLEVTERIRAIDIERVTPRPDISFKPPVTDIIRGGFLPAPTEFRQKSLGGRTAEEFSKYVLEAPVEEWRAAVSAMTGGQTGGSWNFGLGLTDRGDLAIIKKYQEAASAQSVALMDKIKAMGVANAPESLFTEMQVTGTKAMFFREALEAATGTGSAGAAFSKDRMGFSIAKVPFPIIENKSNVLEGSAVKP